MGSKILLIDGRYVSPVCHSLGHAFDETGRCLVCAENDKWLQQRHPDLYARAYDSICSICGENERMKHRSICRECDNKLKRDNARQLRASRISAGECQQCGATCGQKYCKNCLDKMAKAARIKRQTNSDPQKQANKKLLAKYKEEGRCVQGHDKRGLKVCPVCKAKREQLKGEHVCQACLKGETFFDPKLGRWTSLCAACLEAKYEATTRYRNKRRTFWGS